MKRLSKIDEKLMSFNSFFGKLTQITFTKIY